MKVGFIGVGIMGSGMASNILKAGHEVVAYNRTAEKVAPLVAAGARHVTSPAEACHADVVVTMVSDDTAELSLWEGGGLFDALPPGAIHMASSTIGIATTRRLAAGHVARGRGFVTAPVQGRGDMAAAGKLFVLAAGAHEALARCRPIFEAIGQRTFEFGDDPASTTAVKLSANFMIAAALEAMAEGFALTGRYGVSRAAFYEYFTNASFNTIPHKAYGKLMVDDIYQPANFPVPLGLKDVKAARDAAEAQRLAMPMADLLHTVLTQAIGQGFAEEDWAVMARVIDSNSKPR